MLYTPFSDSRHWTYKLLRILFSGRPTSPIVSIKDVQSKIENLYFREYILFSLLPRNKTKAWYGLTGHGHLTLPAPSLLSLSWWFIRPIYCVTQMAECHDWHKYHLHNKFHATVTNYKDIAQVRVERWKVPSNCLIGRLGLGFHCWRYPQTAW